MPEPKKPPVYLSPDVPVVMRAKRSKAPFVILFAVIFIVAGAIALLVWPGWIRSFNAPQSQLPSSASLALSGELTVTKVANLNKEDTFWGYVKNMAQVQKLVTTHEEYRADSVVTRPTQLTYTKIGFDYKSKKFVAAREMATETTINRSKTRCFDEAEYTKNDSGVDDWQHASTDFCTLAKIAPYITDGISVAGLDDSHAQTFVDFLRAQKGLVTVNKLQLSEKNGKKYLQYSVDITPVRTSGGTYNGNGWLADAFTKTGLDAATHPYAVRGSESGGSHLEYYIDPDTQLPVYSEITELPAKDKDGNNLSPQGYAMLRTTYNYSAASFNAATSNESDLALDW